MDIPSEPPSNVSHMRAQAQAPRHSKGRGTASTAKRFSADLDTRDVVRWFVGKSDRQDRLLRVIIQDKKEELSVMTLILVAPTLVFVEKC
ncbi:hypothetical protein RB195_014721 [Necator americanus]|uniref:Uncharacterized protein n=1 Tax=Necator americanus TaxID=51031 RepID=A0ABR1E1J8_NECAM